jgi:hypothetical protein
MYSHHINDMVKALVKENIVIPMKQKAAKEVLAYYWSDMIALTWSAEDVIEHAKNYDKVISKEKAIDILQSILHNHSCEYGVTWDTITEYVTNDGD